MYTELKKSYQNLILKKAELEKWMITIESETDQKLYDLLIGEPIKQKKQKKVMNMEGIVYIIFGKASLESLLRDGLKSFKHSLKK